MNSVVLPPRVYMVL
jgi:hypothetical protein